MKEKKEKNVCESYTYTNTTVLGLTRLCSSRSLSKRKKQPQECTITKARTTARGSNQPNSSKSSLASSSKSSIHNPRKRRITPEHPDLFPAMHPEDALAAHADGGVESVSALLEGGEERGETVGEVLLWD